MNTPIFEFVLGKLAKRSIPWASVARETGIPYDTLKKIARGVTTNPGVLHVQTLYDYFQQKEADLAESKIGGGGASDREALREAQGGIRQLPDVVKVMT